MQNEQSELFDQFNVLMFTKRFLTLCDGINAAFGINIQSEKELSWLKRNYMKSDRYYHTINHIVSSLSSYDTIRDNIVNGHRRLAMQFAIFYHDIIYVPQNGDDFNIKHSVEAARDALSKFTENEFQIQFVRLVQNYIIATNHSYLFSHQMIRNKMDRNSCFMSDIDLYGLSIPWNKFVENNEGIKKEFAIFTYEDFKNGQIEFLNNILSQEKIYLTTEFSVYEKHARHNIQMQIEILSENNQQ